MRIGSCLPEAMFEQIMEPIWDLFDEDVRRVPKVNDLRQSYLDISSTSDSVWHGAALVIAEGSRRGLLSCTHLPRIVQCMVQALAYDQRKGSHSVGSHVRDAACYIAWSVARGFTAEEIEPHRVLFTESLLAQALFDREVHVRRAASAALQEAVGRWNSIPEGIPLITTVDYYAVATKRLAYLEVAATVAQ